MNEFDEDDDLRFEEGTIGGFFGLAEELAKPPSSPTKSEQLRQAKLAFNVAIAAFCLGALIVFAGVWKLLFFDSAIRDGVTVASGIILDVVSVFQMKIVRESNSRLDEIRRDENALDMIGRAFEMVGRIRDSAKRDQAIADLVKNTRRK